MSGQLQNLEIVNQQQIISYLPLRDYLSLKQVSRHFSLLVIPKEDQIRRLSSSPPFWILAFARKSLEAAKTVLSHPEIWQRLHVREFMAIPSPENGLNDYFSGLTAVDCDWITDKTRPSLITKSNCQQVLFPNMPDIKIEDDWFNVDGLLTYHASMDFITQKFYHQNLADDFLQKLVLNDHHFGMHVIRDDMLFDCYCTERKPFVSTPVIKPLPIGSLKNQLKGLLNISLGTYNALLSRQLMISNPFGIDVFKSLVTIFKLCETIQKRVTETDIIIDIEEMSSGIKRLNI